MRAGLLGVHPDADPAVGVQQPQPVVAVRDRQGASAVGGGVGRGGDRRRRVGREGSGQFGVPHEDAVADGRHQADGAVVPVPHGQRLRLRLQAVRVAEAAGQSPPGGRIPHHQVPGPALREDGGQAGRPVRRPPGPQGRGVPGVARVGHERLPDPPPGGRVPHPHHLVAHRVDEPRIPFAGDQSRPRIDVLPHGQHGALVHGVGQLRPDRLPGDGVPHADAARRLAERVGRVGTHRAGDHQVGARRAGNRRAGTHRTGDRDAQPPGAGEVADQVVDGAPGAEGARPPAVLGVVHPHRPVVAGGGQPLPAARGGDGGEGGDGAGRDPEAPDTPAPLVPDPHRAVGPRRHQAVGSLGGPTAQSGHGGHRRTVEHDPGRVVEQGAQPHRALDIEDGQPVPDDGERPHALGPGGEPDVRVGHGPPPGGEPRQERVASARPAGRARLPARFPGGGRAAPAVVGGSGAHAASVGGARPGGRRGPAGRRRAGRGGAGPGGRPTAPRRRPRPYSKTPSRTPHWSTCPDAARQKRREPADAGHSSGASSARTSRE